MNLYMRLIFINLIVQQSKKKMPPSYSFPTIARSAAKVWQGMAGYLVCYIQVDYSKKN